MAVQARIDELVKSEKVVLFMKGTRSFPQCGFSATVVQLLDGVLPAYKTVNVLEDPDIRQGIKEYANWPTIPQLYIDGDFVGGCDIIQEMFASGELQKMLGVSAEPVEPPTIELTPAAVEALRGALAEGGPDDQVHMSVDAKFEHALSLGPISSGDIEAKSGDVRIFVDMVSARRANGVSIDFEQSPERTGFRIDNPNAPPKVAQLTPTELKEKLDSGELKEFYDVRPPSERARANLEAAKQFDDEAVKYIESLPKDTPLAFMCRSGRRSQTAAEHFRELGFTKLYNLAGGVLAWADEIDPKIPKY